MYVVPHGILVRVLLVGNRDLWMIGSFLVSIHFHSLRKLKEITKEGQINIVDQVQVM